MKKLVVLMLVAMLAVVMLTTLVITQESLPFTADLIADGQDTALDVGDITIAVDGTITFQIDEASTDWRLGETHLYMGDEPPARNAPEEFPYKHEELGSVASDIYVIDLAAADRNGDGIVYFAAHAGLIMQIGMDEDIGEPFMPMRQPGRGEMNTSAWVRTGQLPFLGQYW